MTTRASDTRAMSLLRATVDRRAKRDQANYGYDDLFDRDVRDILIKHGIHDFRFGEMPELIGDAQFFATPRKMLDVGCGTAPFVFGALAQGIETYGVDLDFEKISMAHTKVDAFGYPEEWRRNVVLASAYELPYDNMTFDVVTSFQVLEHLDRLAAGLYECVRVTKRGGWLIFRAPDYRMSFEPHYRIPWPQFAPPRLAERWVMAMDRPPGGLDTFYYITLPQVAAHLEALDCEVVVARLDAVVNGRYVTVNGPIAPEKIIIRSEHEIVAFCEEIKSATKAGTLPAAYTTELNFVVAAKRR